MYDKVFKGNNSETSFEDFKQAHLRSSVISAKLVKESFAVNQLERVVQGKNFDDIEAVFQLYSVMKEEIALLGREYIAGVVIDVKNSRLSTSQQNQLKIIRERRQALEYKLSRDDVESLHKISQILKDSKFDVLSK